MKSVLFLLFVLTIIHGKLKEEYRLKREWKTGLPNFLPKFPSPPPKEQLVVCASYKTISYSLRTTENEGKACGKIDLPSLRVLKQVLEASFFHTLVKSWNNWFLHCSQYFNHWYEQWKALERFKAFQPLGFHGLVYVDKCFLTARFIWRFPLHKIISVTKISK